MDILHFSTRSDPDGIDPTTGHDMLDRLTIESRRTAHIMSYAARSEDADQLARDVMQQFSDFAYNVASICEEAETAVLGPPLTRAEGGGVMKAHVWWRDAKGFIREGTLTTDHELAGEGLPVLLDQDGAVLSPEDMEGIEIHRVGTSGPIAEIRDAARRAGYKVVNR